MKMYVQRYEMLIYSVTILTCLVCRAKCMVRWETIHCSQDTDDRMPEGVAPDIGRFSWLGVVQHTFYLGGKSRYAVTPGILIHPGYAIAPAEDMVKIEAGSVFNNTKFIVWKNATTKYAIDVKSFVLHPEYVDKITFATIALVELVPDGQTGVGEHDDPVLPISLPARGVVVLDKLFVVRVTDAHGNLEKEVTRMIALEDDNCKEFYQISQLEYSMMRPTHGLCAIAQRPQPACVWDAGAALITQQTYGYWRLLGFGVRGAGCGAPSRFLNVNNYLPWIDEVISHVARADHGNEELVGVVFRRSSPRQIEFYEAYGTAQDSLGQCKNKIEMGTVLYKDVTKLDTNMNNVQGFFFVSLSQIADFRCCQLTIDSRWVTNLQVWVEHNCFREISGDTPNIDYRKLECFLYYKSKAFIEFRFIFSQSMSLTVTMWGDEASVKVLPNPFTAKQVTGAWLPTDPNKIRWGFWMPLYMWWYWM